MNLLPRFCVALGLTAVIGGIGAALVPLADALLAARPLLRAPIGVGEAVSSRWIDVQGAVVRVGLALTVVPQRAAPEQAGDGYTGLYRFPLHYRVRDQNGEALIDQWVLIEAERDQALDRPEAGPADVPPVQVEAVFDAVRVEDAERVRVEAVLLPDRRYGAEIDGGELRLLRQPPSPTPFVRYGLVAVVAGTVLIVIGVAAAVRRASPAVPQSPARAEDEDDWRMAA